MQTIEDLYIDLLKNKISDYHKKPKVEYKALPNNKTLKSKLGNSIDRFLRKYNFALCRVNTIKEEDRLEGTFWPAEADSMIGMKRLENIAFCVKDVIKNKIPGDVIETGVWKGGASIFMRGILRAYNVIDKKVWVADSFEGLPKPEEDNIHDKGDIHHLIGELAVSLEDVRDNFEKYNLLDDQVVFLKGWFKDTLPTAPIESLSVLRLDGDLYVSTMDAIKNLYPKLSIGGYIIIDDFGVFEGCKIAIEEYRQRHNITEKIEMIDNSGVYWKKLR
jgi:O-methyltransferase